MKQIKIRIFPNGEINAETKGIKGKTCLKYISKIEQLTDAVTQDSDFTKEYLETEVDEITNNEVEVNE